MSNFKRLVLGQRFMHWKLGAVTLIFMAFVFLIQREVVDREMDELAAHDGSHVRKKKMLDMVMDAVNNIKDSMPKNADQGT